MTPQRYPFAARQPQDGETVVHCGHLGSGRHHFSFFSPDPLEFTRLDGSPGEATWLIECQPCFDARAGTDSLAVRGDMVWDGRDPIVEAVPWDDLEPFAR